MRRPVSGDRVNTAEGDGIVLEVAYDDPDIAVPDSVRVELDSDGAARWFQAGEVVALGVRFPSRGGGRKTRSRR